VNGFCESLEAELRYSKAPFIKITTVYPMAANTRLVTDVADRAVYRDRFNPLLTAEEVAHTVVEGVVRDERYIFIPKQMKFVVTTGVLLPKKAKVMLGQFVGAGFSEKK